MATTYSAAAARDSKAAEANEADVRCSGAGSFAGRLGSGWGRLRALAGRGGLQGDPPSARRGERTSEAPIQRRLMLLILGLVVPGLVYSAITTMQVARSDQDRMRARGASIARYVTQAFDQIVARNLMVLEGLARTLAEHQNIPASFEATLRAFSQTTGERIVLVGLDGRAAFSTYDQFSPGGTPVIDRELLGKVVLTRAAAIGKITPAASASGDAGIALAAPVIRRGQVVALVAGFLDLGTLDAVLDTRQIDADWTVALIDHNNTLIARKPDGKRYLGKPANPKLLSAMAGRMSGQVDEYVTREGRPSHAVFDRSAQTGWSVAFAIPSTTLEAPLQSAVARTATLGVFLLLLAMGLAIWGGLLIERPIRRLQVAAAALGRGESINLEPSGIAELDDAGRAFAAAAAERARYEKELKAAAGELQRAAQRTSIALRAGKMGTFQVDIATDQVEWSEELQELFVLEHKPEQTWAESFGPLLHPDDRDAVLARRLRNLETPGQHEDQFRIVRPDGQVRWVNVFRQVQAGADGSPRSYFGLCIDITDRKRGEAALIASEELSRSVLDASPDSIKVLDLSGRPIYLNAQAQINFEAAGGSDIARWSLDCPDEFSADAALAFEAAKAGEKSEFSGAVPGAGGELRWWDVAAIPVAGPNGAVERVLTISRDVTERKNAEAALIASEAFNRSIVHNVTDCVKVLELDSRIAYMNENGQRALEAPNFAAVDGARWVDFWPEESGPIARDAVAAAGAGKHSTFSGHCPTFKGNWRWWDNTITPIFDTAGNVVRLLAVSRDVTERKRSEERQALLVRELAHRSKNLLAVVQSIALQSLKNVADTKARDAFVARLHTLGRSHAMVAHDVFEGAPLRDVVRRELEAFADTATIDGPDLTVSRKAAQNLALAVHELATNAAKYGALKSESGTIAVRWRVTGSEHERRFEFSWTERGGPAPIAPSAQGFGSLLLDRVIASELRANTTADFGREGLTYEIDAPFAEIAAELSPQDGLVVALSPSNAA